MARLKDKYVAEVLPAMMEKFKYKSTMQIPKLEKIVLNMGVGDVKENPKAMDAGKKMYEFADKLFNLALPRVRDFRGVSNNSFDGRGNFSLGVKEQLMFPEIEYDKVEKVRGMDIVFVTTAKTDEEARELLKQLGMPFSQA
jgi:large subunit ribosomal protein L5